MAARLSLNGWVASLTLKNYPGVDVFVFDPKSNRHTMVQVKTSYEKLFYVPETVDTMYTPFVFVHLTKPASARFFVVPAEDVARISDAERAAYIRDRPHVKPQQPRMISLTSLTDYEERWENLWR